MDFAELLMQHQPRLIRWCAVLSDDPGAADDLAQETLIEAWRNQHKLTDVDGIAYWLYAIARNVCLRWRRKQFGQHDLALEEDACIDAFDLEAEREQYELADLLDNALGWLPPDMRRVLSARYLEAQSPEEAAARLGISENVLAVRLHRGKDALRHVLRTHLREQAQAYGLAFDSDDWQPSHLWCYSCGQQRLQVRFYAARGDFALRCERCAFVLDNGSGMNKLIGKVQSIKSVMKRLFNWSNQHFGPAGSRVNCGWCGQPVTIEIGPRMTPRGSEITLDASCPDCGTIQNESLYGQAIHHPQSYAFWQEHKRIRILPQRPLEVDGHPAVCTTFESVRGVRQLHVISSVD
jgi:RNA polymerase sigma factor (sigma-70 family)